MPDNANTSATNIGEYPSVGVIEDHGLLVLVQSNTYATYLRLR